MQQTTGLSQIKEWMGSIVEEHLGENLASKNKSNRLAEKYRAVGGLWLDSG